MLTPRRYIFNDDDLMQFQESPAKSELLKLTTAMGKSCASASVVYQYDPENALRGLSPAMAALHGSLRAMSAWVAEFPPEDDRSKFRFGNPSFRKWHERLLQRSTSIVVTILKFHQQYPGQGDYDMPILEDASQKGYNAAGITQSVESVENERDRDAVIELCAYLHASFGHEVRLDYGTGHECSFQVFLYALCKLGCFGSTPEDPPAPERLKAITLAVWHQYLIVTRSLQSDYMLEPAGSHGVWGLDDYHCLPFYFGACQLENKGETAYTPASIHEDSTLREEGDRYLYFGCIRYIKSLKKGVPFFESSPMLNDISHLPSWHKVASGLLRLFEGEVLGKRQVVQHFVFGRIFAASWTPSESQPREAPQETFRRSADASATNVTRAPWATGGTGGGPPPTRAPWAK